MKKTIQRAMFLAIALILMLLPALALAENNIETDDAGNVLADESAAVGMEIAGDLYCFGKNVDASSAEIAESAILAGQYVNVNNSRIGGSLRAAGYEISAAQTTVDVNATLAAKSINLTTGFAAKAVYAAAQTVHFSGSCTTLRAAAESVTISGAVTGDAIINAETVTITDTAVIGGNLNISSANEPIIASGATVGNLNFTKVEPDTTAESAATAGTAFGFLAKLGKLVMLLPGRILLAVIYYFVIRKTIANASSMVVARPVAMPVSGLIALICVPIVAIILLCTYIGVPAGMLLSCLYALALAFAASFVGCVFGKLLFPKMHTLVAYMIGCVGVTIIKVIPYVGGVLSFGCAIYTLGYFIQNIYLGFEKKSDPTVAAPAVPESLPETASQTESEAL